MELAFQNMDHNNSVQRDVSPSAKMAMERTVVGCRVIWDELVVYSKSPPWRKDI